MTCKSIVALLVLLLPAVSVLAANPDSLIVDGDLRIKGSGSGLVFSDGSVQYSASNPSSASNPYSNIVTNTCYYSQLAPTGEGKCYCPAAPSGYKAIAIQGGAGCDKYDGSLPALESAGMMDNWYGGNCFYFKNGQITAAVPQQVIVKCIYVPL